MAAAKTLTIEPNASRWFVPALALLTLIGFGWRAYRLETPALDHDEVYEVVHATTDLGELAGRTDGFPPLYRWLLGAALQATGDDRTPRWFSALAGALTIPLVGLLGRRLAGDAAGLVSAALLAVSANHLLLSQHGRAYALMVLLGAAMMLSAWRLRQSDRNRDWAAFLVVSWLAIATHYFMGILLLLLAPLVLLEKRGAALRKGLLAGITLGVAGLPLLACLRADMADSGNFFHRVGFDKESYAFSYLWLVTGNTLGPSISELRELVADGRARDAALAMAPWAIAVALPVATLLWLGWRRLAPRDRACLSVLMIAPPLVAMLAAPYAPTGYNYRYVVWMVVPLTAWLAAGVIPRGEGWRAWAGPTAGVVLAAIGVIATLNRHHDPRYAEHDFSAVVALIAREEAALGAPLAPAVVAAPAYYGEAAEYALPAGWPSVVVTANPRSGQDWDAALSRFAKKLGERDHAWLVTQWFPQGHPQHSLCEDLAERLGATLIERVSSTVMVYRFPTERLK